MWLLLVCILEALVAVYSLYHPSFYFILFVALIYLLWYFDGSEFTGRRTWELFRTWSMWKKINPCAYYFAGSDQKLVTYTRRLFVVMPNATCLPLFWGFGLHANQLSSKLDVCYVLPRLLFRIPVLRDILLWTGAICINSESDLIRVLNTNRSVCYCPSGMQDALYVHRLTLDPNASQLVCLPNTELFEYCKKENIHLIPVLVANECVRYRFVYLGYYAFRLQQFCLAKFGYPFPLLYWLKLFDQRKPLPLEIMIADPIDCAMCTSVEKLKAIFKQTVEQLNKNGMDKTIEFVEQ